MSEPTTPTADLKKAQPDMPEVTWSTLEGLVDRGAVDFPLLLRDAAFGMDEAASRRLVERAGTKGMMVAEKQVEGYLVIGTGLATYDGVGFTVILDASTRTLAELDVSMPEEQALLVLREAWGDPQATMSTDETAGPVYTWNNEAKALAVTLRGAPGGKSVAKYAPLR